MGSINVIENKMLFVYFTMSPRTPFANVTQGIILPTSQCHFQLALQRNGDTTGDQGYLVSTLRESHSSGGSNQ